MAIGLAESVWGPDLGSRRDRPLTQFDEHHTPTPAWQISSYNDFILWTVVLLKRNCPFIIAHYCPFITQSPQNYRVINRLSLDFMDTQILRRQYCSIFLAHRKPQPFISSSALSTESISSSSDDRRWEISTNGKARAKLLKSANLSPSLPPFFPWAKQNWELEWKKKIIWALPNISICPMSRPTKFSSILKGWMNSGSD